MDQVDTLHVGRYWCGCLGFPIMTHLSDLEVKVKRLRNFMSKLLLKVFSNRLVDLIDTLLLDNILKFYAVPS